MKVVAKAKTVRMSPRKVGLVAALVRGQKVAEAKQILSYTTKAAAEPMAKVLDSAVANAENNMNLKARDLVVESVLVGAGPTLKRGRPRARGQYNRIHKRTSHITVVVSDLPGQPVKPKVEAGAKASEAKRATQAKPNTKEKK
jgi:large subunit ribosomal protein L22